MLWHIGCGLLKPNESCIIWTHCAYYFILRATSKIRDSIQSKSIQDSLTIFIIHIFQIASGKG